MNKQLFLKIMRLILVVIFSEFINIQCLSTNSDLEHLDKPHIFKEQINDDLVKKQFKKIDNDINELIDQLNNEIKSRHKRAAPRETNLECKVSITELSDLKTVIDSAMTNLSKKNVKCNYTSNNSNNCNELLKLIKCGINNIENEYNKMTTDNASSKKYQNLLNAYNMLNNKYTKVKDDVKALSDQKYKHRIDKLTSDMQILAKKLRESNDIILRSIIDLCAFQILDGNIESSIKEYHNLMDNNKIVSLAKIVENVYAKIKNENKEIDIKNVLKFIEKIPHKCEQFTTYLSLVTKMQLEGHINRYLSNFWLHLKAFSTTCNSQHLSGKITECPTDYIENFNIQLQKIIKYIYEHSVPNAENAINFIDELLTNDQKIIAYPIVFKEMKNRNGLNGYEIVLLGFRIQEIMMTQKLENLTEIMQTKEELPSGIVVLMTADAIRLKTKALSYSNFALNNMLTSSCTESIDQYQDWYVRVHERGRYFQFINVANAHSLRADETKTFVTTGFCARHLWEIIPISNGASFYIKNIFYRNILGVNLQSKTTTSNSTCYQVQVFSHYTGDSYQQWEIKHKI